MAVAAFDPAAWRLRYPEFGAVSDSRAALFFSEATLYVDNTDCSPITDTAQRLVLLNMATAHVAKLAGADTADGTPGGLVGRVSQATEGAVSVQAELNLPPGSAAWWSQTAYGLSLWQATAKLRSAFYVPGPRRSFEPRGSWTWRM